MEHLRQILRLHSRGVSRRQIAKDLGIYKGTVNKYVKLAEMDPLSINELLALEDHRLEARFCKGNTAYTDDRFDFLSSHLEDYMKELEDPHVTKYILWLEYCREAPGGHYSYAQFCHHLSQHRSSRKPSFILAPEREGGMYLFVDFAGDTMEYVDPQTGEITRVQVFVASLPASDYHFAVAVRSQQVEDFLDAMRQCLEHIGGVPTYVVTDNLKAAVVKSDRYQPTINDMMLQFANHYGFSVLPARAYHPKDKALVENGVKLIYRDVYAALRKRVFFSLEEINIAMEEMMLLHNRRRMQQHQYTREERFLSVDKPKLSPLSVDRFEIKSVTQLTVDGSSHVYLGRDKHHYSVDYHHIGKKVKVVYTNTLVEIFLGTEKLASHLRDRTPGAYTTVASHLPSYHQDYQKLSPQRYIERARRVSEALGKVMERIFSSRNGQSMPEHFYASCDGLMHLQKTTEPFIFDMACELALQYDQCRYGFIKQLVKSKCAGYELTMSESADMTPRNSNTRGRAYYN